MKKLFNVCLIIIIAFCLRLNVEALSSNITVNKSTIENGNSVKASVTISGVAAWNVKIYSSGATSGCDANYADATGDGKNTTKTFTVTCKATKTGLINIAYSGDITSEDGTNKTISGSKNVKVTEPRAKSTNNNLSSLSVDGYEISPSFSKDTLEYSVEVPNTVETIKINAKAADSYASVSGTGEVEVLEGINKFEIVVTSETGKEKIYTLNVNVEDKDPIVVNVEGKEYTVVKNKKALTLPELFTETTIDINGFTVPAFYSDVTKITLVGLKNSDGTVKLFVYNNGEYSLYRELKVANSILMLIDKDMSLEYYKKDSIIINEVKYDCYKLSNSSDFALFYGMNMATGKEDYYVYDSLNQTLQRYDNELSMIMHDDLESKDKDINTLYIILAILIIFIIFIIVMFSIKNRKIKKLLNISKDNKEKKNAKKYKKESKE